MKTMLAKANSMQGEYLSQARRAQQAISVISADHAAVLEAMDFKISSLEQQFGNISKKLTVLISLLRHSICQEATTMGERAEEKTNTSQGKLSSQPQAGRATTSIGQDSSAKDYIVLELQWVVSGVSLCFHGLESTLFGLCFTNLSALF